jgi:hypothetical protein
MAQSVTSPARERIPGTVPKLAEIADTLIYSVDNIKPVLSHGPSRLRVFPRVFPRVFLVTGDP